MSVVPRVSPSRSQPVASSGPATSASDPVGGAPQRERGAGADEQHHRLGHRLRGEPAGDVADVGVGGDVVAARRSVAAYVALHPREPENTLGLPVGVVADDVPASRVTRHAPGVEVTGGRHLLAGPQVVEGERGALLDGQPEGVERRLVGAQPRLGDLQCGRRRRPPPPPACALPRSWPWRAGRAARPWWPGRPPRPRLGRGRSRGARTRRGGCGSRARRRNRRPSGPPRSAHRGCATPPCRARTSSRTRLVWSRGRGSSGSGPWRCSGAGPAA